ncbi:kinase-like domain-containing protein [Rhizophagus irregularis DAOM 181602=DAOM 197198]|nr:kinase-like domain-containing protein [Rhizophagus irregularis DAOM 181602=DAOM 197198]
MKQCWDADPLKRPNIKTLSGEIDKLNLIYQTKSNDLIQLEENDSLDINSSETYTSNSSSLFTSKLHQFDNLPKPKNATEEELEAFHSKSLDFNIPDNIDDFDKVNNQKNSTSKLSSIFKVGSKKLSKIFKRNSKNDIQNNYKEETMQHKVKKNDNNFDDEDEIYNNPNFHSEEQNEFELPDEI